MHNAQFTPDSYRDHDAKFTIQKLIFNLKLNFTVRLLCTPSRHAALK